MRRMRFLLDHNVPDSVAVFLRSAGYDVLLVREILPTDSPDQLVATVSEEEGAVLVSSDTDFKRIAPRIPLGERARFRRLSRISLCCSEYQAARRLEEAMELIELEWRLALKRPDSRIHIVIQATGIKTNR